MIHLFQDNKMKSKIYIFFFILCLLEFGCAVSKRFSIGGSTFETPRMHAYGANKIILANDSSFVFYEQGPTTRFSTGTWKFDSKTKKLTFNAVLSESRTNYSLRFDTLWINISNYNGQVLSKNKIFINGILYYKLDNIP